MSQQAFDLAEVTPEQFAQIVVASSDDQLLAAIREIGTQTVLNRVFEGMQERFATQNAQGVDAEVQWVVTDADEEYTYAITIRGGSCSVRQGLVENPRSTLTTDLVRFCRLLVGQANGPKLFMQGGLKVAGDLMFATRVESLFEKPKA